MIPTQERGPEYLCRPHFWVTVVDSPHSKSHIANNEAFAEVKWCFHTTAGHQVRPCWTMSGSLPVILIHHKWINDRQ